MKLEKGMISDFISISRMFEWVGIGFGKEENYRIQLALRLLLKKTLAKDLRFWGKIHATKKDYYIAEGKVK